MHKDGIDFHQNRLQWKRFWWLSLLLRSGQIVLTCLKELWSFFFNNKNYGQSFFFFSIHRTLLFQQCNEFKTFNAKVDCQATERPWMHPVWMKIRDQMQGITYRDHIETNLLYYCAPWSAFIKTCWLYRCVSLALITLTTFHLLFSSPPFLRNYWGNLISIQHRNLQ